MLQRIYKWVKGHPKALRNHLLLFAGVSVVFGFIAESASINSYIHHPQFTHWDQFDRIRFEFLEHKKWWFYGFFFTDSIWAFLLLSAPMHMLIRLKMLESPNGFNTAKTIGIYALLALIAYGFDLFEGVLYVIGYDDFLQTIVELKEFFYVIGLILFLYGVLRYWSGIEGKNLDAKGNVLNTEPIKTIHLRAIRIFLSTSILSILVIVIIGGLLTALQQGATIVVQLFHQPINLVLLMPLLFLLAVVVSHYPAYFEARGVCLADHISWKMYDGPVFKWFAENIGFGIVYYELESEGQSSKDGCCKHVDPNYPFNPLVKVWRHHLGSLVFVSFLYVLLFSANTIYDFPIPSSTAIIVFIGAIIFYDRINRIKRKHRRGGGRQDRGSKISRYYKRSAIASIGLVSVLFVVVKLTGWNIWSLSLSMLTVVSFLATYITFRLARKNFYGKSNLWLMKRITFLGTITILILIAANLSIWYATEHLNAITILLLYLLNFYGIIAIATKHVQFYYDNPKEKRNFLRFALPMVPVLLLFWSFSSASIPDDLHDLPRVVERDGISFDFFEKTIKKRDSLGKYPNYIMTTSYGGGLMANVWAMFVYNELQEITNGQFINSTINMSANSGGSIGIGNYANLWANHKDVEDQTKIQTLDTAIQKIGNFNHLAIDLTYILGADLIREMLPFVSWNGKDRSYHAMKQYAIMTGDQDTSSLKRTSFREHWKSIYDALGYYPTLAISTTATDGNLGTAFSLKDKEQHKKTFRGIYNILDVDSLDGSSISYYGALSASNRFPLFSPNASIPNEGHFLDGGYFDNSGLMNSLEWLKHLIDGSIIPHDTCRIQYVMINNSKSKYIKHLLKDWIDREKNIKGTGEISAIINTVVAVDKISTHLENEVLTYDPDPVAIYLPLRFTFDDVVETLGGKPDLPFKIQDVIDQNNRNIQVALDSASKYYYQKEWGIVESPLARVLSIPAVRYQKAMIEYHPDVQRELKRVLGGTDCE